jgi:integrase
MSEQRNKPGTAKEYARLLRRHFLPAFERRPLGEITTRNVCKILDHLVNAPSECFHATVAVKIFFRWAAQRGLVRDNPCEHIRPTTKSTPRDRASSDTEQAIVIRASQQFGFPFGTIVLLLVFTGQRRGEVAALHWEWIDDDATTIMLPASVTKNKSKHTFPYGKLVADVLESIPRQGDLLFPARGRSDVPYSGWSNNKIALDRVCEIEPWTLHDLRRTFATNLAALGTPPHGVEKLLNHASGTISGVAAIYNQFRYMDEMRAAIDRRERRLAEIVTSL